MAGRNYEPQTSSLGNLDLLFSQHPRSSPIMSDPNTGMSSQMAFRQVHEQFGTMNKADKVGAALPRYKRLRRVVIESPYAGDQSRTIQYARDCLLDSLKREEAPIASHLLHTQVLEDSDLESRELGLHAGWSWSHLASLCVVYTDLGISKGMQEGISIASQHGIEILFRSLEKWAPGEKNPHLSPTPQFTSAEDLQPA